MRLLMLVVVVLVGCGRVGFEMSRDSGSADSRLLPSNDVDWPDGVELKPLSISNEIIISSDDGSIVEVVSGRILRAGGEGLISGVWFELRPDLGVFAMSALDADAMIGFSGVRSVIILVEGRAAIRGQILVVGGRFDVEVPGPGGGAGGITMASPATGCAPGRAGEAPDIEITGTDGDGGGAGGGFGTGGGGGSPHVLSGPATSACGSDTLEPLVGGSGGGAGAVFPQLRLGGRGGGGGGGLQLTSASEIIIDGVVDAGGAGGENGRTGPPPTAMDWGGGGGGGAGGAILLEAPTVTISAGAAVAANGGGGGADVGTGTAQRGTLTSVPALGGTGVVNGGAGCASSSAVARDGDDILGQRDAAGGGGGCGRIRINAEVPAVIDGVVSPAPTIGEIKRRM